MKDGATPFQRDAVVYCKNCPRWTKVERTIGFRKDNINYYGFRCHGKDITLPTSEVIGKMQVNGPQHKSFLIDFN